MKKIIALFTFATLSFHASFGGAFAATETTTTQAKPDHFEVTIKSPVKVGEASDMAVKVVDKAGGVVKNYNGTIYVTVDNDSKATVPYSEDGYTFKNADQGVMTFAKGLSFTKEGKMKVTVLDAENDSLEGVATVTVTNGALNEVSASKETVTITSPDNNSEIPSDSTKVTGTAKKNSKIQIYLNGKQVGDTQSDEMGAFIYDLKKLDQEQNILQTKLLDGTDKVIGESEKVSFKMSVGGPVFNSITIKEGKKVAMGASLNIEVSAEAKLKEVTLTMGENTVTLKGGVDGKYTGVIMAPSTIGSFPIGVILKNDLGKITSKEAAETIETTDLPDSFKNIKSEVGNKRVTFTFEVASEPTNLSKFKFQYGSDSGTLSKESMTLEKEKIKSGSGKVGYTWYIKDLDPATKYFRILGLDSTGKEVSKMKASEIFEVDISLAAASKCMVSAIANLKVTPGKETTILSWDAAPDANFGYNVYKKGTDGQYTLIENVKTNTYTIHISEGKVTHDDFAVKGVCNNGEGESADYAEATNVTTGPTQVLILLAISILVGFFVTRRKLSFFRGN